MSYEFRPASMEDQAGIFVSVSGGTNSGKTYSALRLARGLAGPTGKIAAADTESKRMSHYAKDFVFDKIDMEPPFRPERFSEAAYAAEQAGYAAMIFDSHSMEWVGPGGVLDWQQAEFKRLGEKEGARQASWIKPKMAHKAMVYSYLQRRIPLIFCHRAEEKIVDLTTKPVKKLWTPSMSPSFAYEITVALTLSGDAKGVIDLNLPHKLEKDHEAIFKHGDLLTERHGELLLAWARGNPLLTDALLDRTQAAVKRLAGLNATPEVYAKAQSNSAPLMADLDAAERGDLKVLVIEALSVLRDRIGSEGSGRGTNDSNAKFDPDRPG